MFVGCSVSLHCPDGHSSLFDFVSNFLINKHVLSPCCMLGQGVDQVDQVTHFPQVQNLKGCPKPFIIINNINIFRN